MMDIKSLEKGTPFEERNVLEKGGLIVECSTHGIQLSRGENIQLDMLANHGVTSMDGNFRITRLIYSAWWYFCRQYLGLSEYMEEMKQADFSPVHFRIIKTAGAESGIQGHASINRMTGTAGNIWQEEYWEGKFAFALEGLAFTKLPLKRDFSSIKPVIGAFLKMLNDGVISIGSSFSGKGRVTIENFEEVSKALLSSKISGKVRCAKGHIASRQKRSFGGKCKCGADIRPVWTIPFVTARSEQYNLNPRAEK